MPSSSTPAISREVAIGRRMKRVENPTGHVFLRVTDVAGRETWNGFRFFMLPPTPIFLVVVPAQAGTQ